MKSYKSKLDFVERVCQKFNNPIAFVFPIKQYYLWTAGTGWATEAVLSLSQFVWNAYWHFIVPRFTLVDHDSLCCSSDLENKGIQGVSTTFMASLEIYINFSNM